MTVPTVRPLKAPHDRDWRRSLQALTLHAQALEAAHAALADLQREFCGASEPIEIGFGPQRRRRHCAVPLDPQNRPLARWARADEPAPEGRGALAPYPGYGNASILLNEHIVIGIFISKEEESKVQAIVDSVFYSQRERQDFVPIFVTESSNFPPFVAKGYVFEYLPPLDDALADQEWAHAWRKGRLDLIMAKWGISHFVNDRGQIANGHMLSSCRPKVFVYPDYGPVNPYIEMMYRQLRENWDVVFGSAETAAAVAAKQGPVVFHLHWEDAVYRGERRHAIPARMAALLTAIDRLKKAGGRFAWTVHNLQPHETADRELHAEFMRELATRADILHVNSPWAAESLIEEYGPNIPVKVIDHPSYVGCYPQAESREEAAAALDLAVGCEEPTFLFLGQIRRYKGLERLLNVAPDFAGEARFVVAGRSGRFDPSGSLPPNCARFSGFVDDQTLSRLFAVADFVVLPFERLTTSGSLLLTLSFGKPVIAPALGPVAELVSDGREAFLYDPAERDGLARSIRRAIDAPDWKCRAMGKAAAATAAFYAPEAFSAAVCDMYGELLEVRAQPSVDAADDFGNVVAMPIAIEAAE